jgi:hypothetical protein
MAENIEVTAPAKKASRKLKTLVYAGLATGFAGVCSTSAALHGNASSHGQAMVDWNADTFTVVKVDEKAATPVVAEKTTR